MRHLDRNTENEKAGLYEEGEQYIVMRTFQFRTVHYAFYDDQIQCNDTGYRSITCLREMINAYKF